MKTLREHSKGPQQQSACAQANQVVLRTAATRSTPASAAGPPQGQALRAASRLQSAAGTHSLVLSAGTRPQCSIPTDSASSLQGRWEGSRSVRCRQEARCGSEAARLVVTQH